MDIQLKKGIIELVILNALNHRDYYGYELNSIINTILHLNESTVYAILKKLINKQWCDHYVELSKSGPPRKYYKITDLGKRMFDAMTVEWCEFQDKINALLTGNGSF